MAVQSRRPQIVHSPNYDARPIAVRFLVIHYTAVDRTRTLQIFADPARKVAAHLVIDGDGSLDECVPCWDGVALRAWHAGQSRWSAGDDRWETLNDTSIGVELVNFNGNVLDFTDAQYETLAQVIRHLAGQYPALRAADSLLGHEQVAGFRGKADPGWCFDWPRVFAACYPDQPAPVRLPVCPPALRAALARFVEIAPDAAPAANAFWERVSLLTETAVALAVSDGHMAPSHLKMIDLPITKPDRA